MSSPRDREEAWLTLGRFLPRSVRSRVFEPAMLDRRLAAERSGRAGRSVCVTAQVLVFLDSLRIGMPALAWRWATVSTTKRAIGLLLVGGTMILAALKWTHRV